MSVELEQIIKQSLDGWFYGLCQETGKSVKRRVSHDFMPCFEPHGLKFTGANNAGFKPWTDEDDEKIIKARNIGLTWRKIGLHVKRNTYSVTLRYYDLCKERGIEPLTDARRLKVCS